MEVKNNKMLFNVRDWVIIVLFISNGDLYIFLSIYLYISPFLYNLITSCDQQQLYRVFISSNGVSLNFRF